MDNVEFETVAVSPAVPFTDNNSDDSAMFGVMAFENTVLKLHPPFISQATIPVNGADVGVPKRIYDLDPQGASISVQAFLGQQPGDNLYLDLDNKLGIASAQTQTFDDTVNMRLPRNLLRTDIVNSLSYRVVRNSLNVGSSDQLKVLYNFVRAGVVDRIQGDDGHSELELKVSQDVLDTGIDLKRAQQGVLICVAYPYCRPYDVIHLNFNGFDVFYTVKPTEAPASPSMTPTTICLTFHDDTFLQAGDHPQFALSFTVTDQIGNGTDPDSPWSATLFFDVDLAGVRFPGLIFREDPNDFTDVSDIVDLGKLLGKPLLAIVLTNDNRVQAGDTVEVTVVLKIPGQADVVLTATGKVELDPFGQKKPCVVEFPTDRFVAGSRLTGAYKVLRNGTQVGESRTANASVIGNAVPVFKQPRLQTSDSGVLDPLHPANLPGANGQVEVLGHHPGDKVQLIVRGASGPGSPAFAAKSLNANSRANFPLDRAFIVANLGKSIAMSYLLFRDGKPLPPSPILNASVRTIASNDPRLPTPVIDTQTGPALEVARLGASSQLRIEEWAQQLSGQSVWLKYSGTDGYGKSTFFEDLRGEPHNGSGGLVRDLPYEWFLQLKPDSEVVIEARVNFSGLPDSLQAVGLPKRTYLIKAPMSEDFEGQTPGIISSPGVAVTTPVLKFELLSVKTLPANPVVKTHGGITINGYGLPGKQLYWYTLGGEVAWITLWRPCQRLVFYFGGNLTDYLEKCEIKFYGPNGLLGSRRLSIPNVGIVDFSGPNIIRMELTAITGAGILLDDIRLLS